MHGRLYNELVLEIAISPRTPLIIKSGEKAGIDPARPDMEFVRTRKRIKNGDIEQVDEVVYIPGSSLRGVMRAHAERLVRSVNESEACFPDARKFCLKERKVDERKSDADELYKQSCYICKLFGNTGIASRLQVGDLYPYRRLEPLTETRYGVAIDRVTGAVAVGPFQMEVVTSALFIGKLLLRNFTIGQLGLLSAVLLDIGDGLVALGHAKSRGLGRVNLHFSSAQMRFSKPLNGYLLGIGALADPKVVEQYGLNPEDKIPVEQFPMVSRAGVYHTLTLQEDDQIRRLLEATVPRWVEEVS